MIVIKVMVINVIVVKRISVMYFFSTLRTVNVVISIYYISMHLQITNYVGVIK